MACSGRYAEAWQYAAFFCIGALLKRIDDSGAASNPSLTDSQINFLEAGVKANVGMVLYNLTDGSSGPVTAVAAHTLTATLAGGSGNDWDDGDEYRIVLIDAREIAQIELYLDIAATDVHVARRATGGCDCTLAADALNYLAKINIIEAGLYHQCPCAKNRMTDEMRQAWIEWATNELDKIRTGKIELCAGETGSEFPYSAAAELGTTEFAQVEIILNDILRGS